MLIWAMEDMRDGVIILVCILIGVLCVAVLAVLPAQVSESDLTISGTAERVFTPAGLTIAHVRMSSTVPVLFMDGRSMAPGDLVVANVSIERLGGQVEFVAR